MKNEDETVSTVTSADPTGRDPRQFGDELLAVETDAGRGRCPVAHTPDGEVLVAGHAEAVEVATDAATYSSAVSEHLQIPNGLDGAEHTRFRRLIERYLEPGVIARYEEDFRRIAREVIAEHLTGRTARVDAVAELGATYAVRTMTAWLGWPTELEPRLTDWITENAAATRSGERDRTAAVAETFDEIIGEVVRPRLENPEKFRDVTSELVHDTTLGRRLEFAEIVSILRNWTAGDLGSMARCIGVLLHALGEDTVLQEHLRFGVSEEEISAVVDELLRIDNPFVANRRVTTRPVTLAGVELPEGQRLRIHWTAANRDPEEFAEPGAYAPEDNAEKNLVWGTGPHVCPGRTLSMLEIRVLLEELLATATIWPTGDREGVREVHPVGGWQRRPVELEQL